MENQTQNSAPTFETVWATLQEASKLHKENERLFAELRQTFKESDLRAEKARQEKEARAEKARQEKEERAEKARQEAKKARQETEAREEKARQEAEAREKKARQEIEAKFDKMRDEFWQSVKSMQKDIGGVSNSNGAVAESYFINSFTKSMRFAGQKYDEVTPNLKKSIKALHLQAEYDLVLYNCSSIVIIEIKYKADKDDVEGLLRKAPVFKQLFPQYVNYDLYLGLAALHIDAITEKESLKQGIAVIKQVGDTMVINDAQLKVF